LSLLGANDRLPAHLAITCFPTADQCALAIAHPAAAGCDARISAYEAKMGESANPSLKLKGYLAMTWLVALARRPAILSVLENLIGPDIMLFGASIFSRGSKDRAHVSWHQDGAYFGLDPHVLPG
jgi:hypothetical protein